MRKITSIILSICILAALASIPANASFAVTPAVSAGANHSVALASNGTVFAWGDNERGQLGDGTRFRRHIPVQVPGLRKVAMIAAGRTHTLALRNDGTVRAWGENAHGQLGDGTTTLRTSPVQVEIENVIAIDTHDTHNLALLQDGTVYAWGDNGRGQLGNGTWISHSSVPVQVEDLQDVTAIAAGWGHSLALTSDGTVWAWGLGVPNRNAPVQVQDLDNVIAIAAGGTTGAAIRADGTVWTWDVANPTPEQVPGLSGVVDIAVGAEHVLARRVDDTLFAWGRNIFGQLGNGTLKDSDAPVQLPEFYGVTAIAAHDHNLAVRDGVVFAWGNNIHGQLGNGADGLESSTDTPGAVRSPFRRGLIRDDVLDLFDTHPWWRSCHPIFQFMYRWLWFGWVWM